MKKYTNPDNQVNILSAPTKNFCPVHATIEVFSGKWKMAILWNLRHEKKRFGQLRHSIPGITQAMLSNHLQDLEKDQIIHREIYAELPPRVEYSLTPVGQSLIPVIATMEKWGVAYLEKQKKHANKACLWDEANAISERL